MPVCPKCGVQLPEDAVFCSQCGTRITAPSLQKQGEKEGPFSGTYTLESQGIIITLILKQDTQGKISGSLSSIKGMQFRINGQIEEDAAVGTCHDDKGGVYFEAYLKGNQLLLTLIEPDANNMPDYNKVRELTLTRQGGEAASGNIPESSPTIAKASGNEVGNPNWGFKFQPPAGWKSQVGDRATTLGHDTIAGVILVLPHMATSFQEVQQQMLKGIAEEGTYLSPISAIQPISNSAIAGDYSGIYNGQQVKARGIGTVSPYGGGAFIIALTTPEKFSKELSESAEDIAKGMQYSKVEASDLMQHFAGTWVNNTRNTETKRTLTPNGEYFENYEASYGGQFRNQYGEQTGYWGTAGQDQNRGRWTVRGNREQGQIVITFQDGRQIVVEYKVHVEKGQVYWREYWFNGELYGKQ